MPKMPIESDSTTRFHGNLLHPQASELVIGGEAPEVEMHSFVDRKLSTKFTAHEKRVKAACFTSLGSQDQSYLITASNDGFIKMWRLSVS